MEKTVIKLQNGQTVSSGEGEQAILSVKLTRAVNSGGELALGAVCAAMAEIQLICETESPIAQGDSFELYAGQRKIGVFFAEKPNWISAHRVRIVAYDSVSRLDKDLSPWLQAMNSWPVTLRELAEAVCAQCGVVMENVSFPNQDFPAKPFTGKNVTGRRILGWIAQAAGRFCRANEDGVLAFGWYQPVQDKTIGPGDKEDQNKAFYYRGSLELADYQTAPIEKIQIRQNSLDVGIMYPDIGQANTYVLQGNPLLTADDSQELLPIAQSLYEQLKDVCYTPCQVKLNADTGLAPGDIVEITDRNGRTATVYLMESCRSAASETFKCVGSPSRDSVSAVNQTSLESVCGKMMNLQMDVEGLRAEHADAAGNVAALSVTVDAIENRVAGQSADLSGVKEQMTLLQQDKESLELQIQSIREAGVDRVVTSTGYRFSDEGLQISKSGLEMKNLLDHTGMYVSRNGQTILQANNRGVEARDVTVNNYLILGNHARFEDYDGGTACFFI